MHIIQSGISKYYPPFVTLEQSKTHSALPCVRPFQSYKGWICMLMLLTSSLQKCNQMLVAMSKRFVLCIHIYLKQLLVY